MVLADVGKDVGKDAGKDPDKTTAPAIGAGARKPSKPRIASMLRGRRAASASMHASMAATRTAL
jgi:hypothetical protein